MRPMPRQFVQQYLIYFRIIRLQLRLRRKHLGLTTDVRKLFQFLLQLQFQVHQYNYVL